MNDFIPENRLIEFFRQDGKRFLDAHRQTGKLFVAPGKGLYYELYRADESTAPNGVLILCHGYTETCTKYHEMTTISCAAATMCSPATTADTAAPSAKLKIPTKFTQKILMPNMWVTSIF